DGLLGAVEGGPPGRLLLARGHDPVADDHAVADLVRLEQLGGEAVAAAVALAAVPVDAHPHDAPPSRSAPAGRRASPRRSISCSQSPGAMGSRPAAGRRTDPNSSIRQ